MATKTTESAETTAPATEEKAAKSSAKDKKGKSPLTPKQIEHFRGLLLAERARLEEEREQIRSRSGAVDGALPEEGEGGDEDTADLANAMMDKEMDLSVEDEIEDLLSAVDHALQKMDDGTYGICDMSGEPIPPGRLELIPYAALTVECQAISEG
ncbi:MAG TPA: TraR/DksA C4-type zinc finger protein [Abditibacteriaceae bacterium]|jgi:RNA polymerase-binding protein DksA